MPQKTPACDSPLDPNYNYIAIRFINAFWADISACCIYPPDAAFCDDHAYQWYDADDKPIPTPAGKDGHRITILWRMDEPNDKPQIRPRLYAILAAFAHLYSRRVFRDDALEMLMVRYVETPYYGSDVPPANFCLWSNSFTFMEDSLRPRWVEGTVFEKKLPPAAPACPRDIYDAAAAQWRSLVNARLKYLLSIIHSAESFEMLKTMLDEWVSYTWQFGYDEALARRVERLCFKPWYAEALRRMPGLNEHGLCCLALPSIGRFALLDYRPEEGRRFCFEEIESRCHWGAHEGKLQLARNKEEALPYDAGKHLHLLPVVCNSPRDYVRIAGVKVAHLYRENWLGRDYCWDKPTE